MKNALQIAAGDNVAVALADIRAGEALPGAQAGAETLTGETAPGPGEAALGVAPLGVVARTDIPRGHKIALSDIKAGENIIKYGHPIGHATVDIPAGAHVHTHNLKTNLKGLLEYTYEPQPAPCGGGDAPKRTSGGHDTPGTGGLDTVREGSDGMRENGDAPVCDASRRGALPVGLPRRGSGDAPVCDDAFWGYVRRDGSVGIRNEIWIVNTVGCVNMVAETLARKGNELYGGETDGIYAFAHPFGCSQLGDDARYTQSILRGMVNHPNAGGVLVLGLGCENNHIPLFKGFLGSFDPDRVKFLVAQESEDEIADGLAIIGELVEYAKGAKRERIPAGKLVIGLKCGGSDGLSGISANPLVGRVADMLAGCGGTAILSEVPEMFGAETILMNRAKDEGVFRDIVRMINDFKEYFMRYNQEVYENPSPGNKEGGITTLEDKSLGCVQKGGTGPVNAVLDYGDRAAAPGLNLLYGPGNDIVAITALMAAGAHIILFTTGRGTPVGAPVPTMKIATNTPLATKKPGWIDFDAGRLLGDAGMDDLAGELFCKTLRVASGVERTRNEANGYREIAIFKDGVTL
ncbi:MAG: altronate dehydratase family protein [Lachnospiraceae bacterium]|nr:altronate dehydratase family protein [Lachnospiraceae bacterium]